MQLNRTLYIMSLVKREMALDSILPQAREITNQTIQKYHIVLTIEGGLLGGERNECVDCGGLAAAEHTQSEWVWVRGLTFLLQSPAEPITE